MDNASIQASSHFPLAILALAYPYCLFYHYRCFYPKSIIFSEFVDERVSFSGGLMRKSANNKRWEERKKGGWLALSGTMFT
jgi:hypothetical protein